MSQSPLVIENLSFHYRTRPEKALKNVSFELRPGELLLIAGSSGCGKTTLARCINGLIPRSYKGERDGKVLLHGKDVSEMQIADVAQTVGTLLQDPERQIVASNVFNEVAFGPENLGFPREEILSRVGMAMKRLKIATPSSSPSQVRPPPGSSPKVSSASSHVLKSPCNFWGTSSDSPSR